MKIKPVLGENGKFLKKVFDVLTSLSICISGSHSFNPRLTSHETLIPNNNFFWMRKGSYSWVFALLVLDLILLIFVGPSCIRCFIIMHLCIMHLFICIAFFLCIKNKWWLHTTYPKREVPLKVLKSLFWEYHLKKCGLSQMHIKSCMMHKCMKSPTKIERIRSMTKRA